MHEYEAGIIRTENRGGNIHIIHLSCEALAREAAPGQFVQVKAGDGTDPFLRRTFSLYGVDRAKGHIKLMIEVVGHGTELLARARHGECLNIIGPLGRGFDLNSDRYDSCVLIAGGVGAAPLFFLADTMRDSGADSIVFMAGAHTAEIHGAFDGLFGDHVTVMIATDDGSLGYHGLVTGLLREHLVSNRPDMLYACGPSPMMKEVAVIAAENGIGCRVSLEERMACGLGACYGCAVRLRDGRIVRSCAEGPVFDANEVDW